MCEVVTRSCGDAGCGVTRGEELRVSGCGEEELRVSESAAAESGRVIAVVESGRVVVVVEESGVGESTTAEVSRVNDSTGAEDGNEW